MNEMSGKQIDDAISVLENGGVIVFPTETSYGIGCDATNVEAVQRILAIKGRPNDKGLPVLIPSKEDAKKYVEMNSRAQELAERFWPGGLNIIAPTADASPIAVLCSKDGLQSVRVTSHPIAATLVRRFGRPVVATSANVAGQAPAYEVKEARSAFKGQLDQPDLFLSGGELPVRPVSTIVKVSGDELEVLRQGEVRIV